MELIFTRSDVIDAARRWINTPYFHMQAKIGIGCDCVGLIIGVHDTLYGESAGSIPIYSRWWAEETAQELMINTMKGHKHLVEIPVDEIGVGDIFVMRIKYKGPAKHCGILSYDDKIIHTYSHHAVLETDFPPGWRKKIGTGFRYKNLQV